MAEATGRGGGRGVEVGGADGHGAEVPRADGHGAEEEGADVVPQVSSAERRRQAWVMEESGGAAMAQQWKP